MCVLVIPVWGSGDRKTPDPASKGKKKKKMETSEEQGHPLTTYVHHRQRKKEGRRERGFSLPWGDIYLLLSKSGG